MSAAELLRWYIDAGVDEALEDEPVNRFVQATAPAMVAANAPAASAAMPAATFSAPVLPARERPELIAAIAEARALADAASTREELITAIQAFEGCALKKTARKTVICDGNPEAKVMLIGEAPGQNEDEQGIPFCGASGMLLDTMLGHIGLSRADSIYISNSVFWRPPANRTPTEDELDICRPFVERHVSLIEPKLILLAGATATKAVLQRPVGITKLRGSIYSYTNQYIKKEIPVIATFHPSYLLRTPSQKRLAWQDLLFVREFIVKNM